MLIEGILSLAIARKGRSRDFDLLSNDAQHGLRNLFDFHEGTARKLQESQLDSKPQAVRWTSSTIDEFSFFLGEGVVSSHVSIREVGRNLGQRVTLVRG